MMRYYVGVSRAVSPGNEVDVMTVTVVIFFGRLWKWRYSSEEKR